jgi:hypothetical protein
MQTTEELLHEIPSEIHSRKEFPNTATESMQASNFATITHHEIRAAAEALNPSFPNLLHEILRLQQKHSPKLLQQGPFKYLAIW